MPLLVVSIDFATTYMDVRTAYDNVGKWAESRRAEFNLNFAAMGPRVREEPKGVVVIMAPFNGPIFLLLSPLVGALAAGCTVVLKPSEQTPATSTLFAELVPKYLDNDTVLVINGAIPETTKVCPAKDYTVALTQSYNASSRCSNFPGIIVSLTSSSTCPC